MSTIELCDRAFLICAKVQKIVSRESFQEENLYKGIRFNLNWSFPRIMPKSLTVLLAFFFACQASASDLSEYWFSSSTLQAPLRLEDLSGDKIVEMTKSLSSIPLLYPKTVSIFERMDGSMPRMYTLNQLATNPGLSPVHKFQSTKAIAKEKSISTLDRNLKLAEREKKLFDTSLLLVPKSSAPLPTDEQLKAFLEDGRRRYTPPVDSKEIIDNLLKDEYANHPVVSLLNDSPEMKKALNSESFNRSSDILFSTANLASRIPVTTQPYPVYSENLPEPPTDSIRGGNTEELKHLGKTSMKLQARKPSRDGTLQPAQASEIYLTTQDLKELLKDISADPVVAGEVRSVAELWAKAEKNVSQNPEVALGVKSILLSAKVGRTRTDPYGQASLENLSPDDKYFVIGIDKDVDTNVVTIWSKEVEVTPGENLVELTSTDVIYQE